MRYSILTDYDVFIIQCFPLSVVVMLLIVFSGVGDGSDVVTDCFLRCG